MEDGEIGGLRDIPDPAAVSGGRPGGGISTCARSARRRAACAVPPGGWRGSADKVVGGLTTVQVDRTLVQCPLSVSTRAREYRDLIS